MLPFTRFEIHALHIDLWMFCDLHCSPTFCATLPLMHESLLRKQQKSQGKQATKNQCKTCRRAWNWGVLPSNQWLKVLRWCNKIWDCNCYCNNCWGFFLITFESSRSLLKLNWMLIEHSPFTHQETNKGTSWLQGRGVMNWVSLVASVEVHLGL